MKALTRPLVLSWFNLQNKHKIHRQGNNRRPDLKALYAYFSFIFFLIYQSINLLLHLKKGCAFSSAYLSHHSPPFLSSSVPLIVQGSSRPWLASVVATRPLTASVSCGLALNCAPATVNVYVYQSNAMCLCYMALWTRRLSKAEKKEFCPGHGVYGPLSIREKWSISWRIKIEQKIWLDFVFKFTMWTKFKAGQKEAKTGENKGKYENPYCSLCISQLS